jgi:hypothetical protein
MQFSTLLVTALFAASGMGAPVADTYPAPVESIEQNTEGGQKDIGKLTAGTIDFLKKYQQYSEQAEDYLGDHEASFTNAGYCFDETPCLTVSKIGTAVLRTSDKKTLPEISNDQIGTILDKIVSTPNVTFGPTNDGTAVNGYFLTESSATLKVIGPSGNFSSAVLAGFVFDSWKVQAGDNPANAVRSRLSKNADSQQFPLGFCLYPETADEVYARNFCFGKELDGTGAKTASKRDTVKRGVDARSVEARSLLGIAAGLCEIIEIPLICT